MKKKETINPKKINMNVSNILRASERCGIKDGWTLSLDDLYVRYKTCKEHTKSLMAESPAFRKIFLSQQLIDVMNQKKRLMMLKGPKRSFGKRLIKENG